LMKKILIYNWKMAPGSLKEAASLFKRTQIYADKTRTNAEIVIAPPFVYLPLFADLGGPKRGFTRIKIAAQNVFGGVGSAYTGEISPKMLKNLGVEYVIIGHSERRKYLNETDEMINGKVLAALKAGLKVVLCIGEPKRELRIKNYELRMKIAKNYIRKQLTKDLKGIHNSLIVAYEPVWAIGAGKPCYPKDAAEMIKFIKRFLSVKYQASSVKVLYGGSVDSKNIKNFVKYPEIDGVLVGGASFKKDEVEKIIMSSEKV